MEIRSSAHRHGIGVDDILHVIHNPMTVLIVASPYGQMSMHLGWSRSGTELEVGTIEDHQDGQVAIHAMPMRTTYRRHLGT